MRLPRNLLRYTLLVEPYLGDAGNGPRYGPPVAVPCHLMPTTSTTRTPQGRNVGDSTTALCQLDAERVLTPEARTTVDGRVVEVERIDRHALPGGPTPNHLAVIFR